MKKFVLLTVLLVSNVLLTFAQGDITLYIADYPEDMWLCLPNNQRVIIYAQDGCENFHWGGDQLQEHANPFIVDPQEHGMWYISYHGCNEFIHEFVIEYVNSPVPNGFTHSVWKHQGEMMQLEAVGNDSIDWPYFYTFQWSTGVNTRTIDVTETGTYSVDITGPCGTATRTFIVRDNVELYRATCDLRSNLNQVTWQTTPQQAEYISTVNIYRNTYQLVATVPYLDGSFTDNIGSESTQWQYHIVGVDNEGNECPIPSYWKRTIHLDHVQGTGGGEILQWTPYEEENPAKDVVVAYAIYDVVNGEPNHVMDVGNFTNVYAYNPNDFNGYGTVAAVFAGKDMEDLAFSNLTSEILDVGETQQKNLSVYPNPTNGTFTVQGAKTLTLYNTMGQVVARSDNDEGKHSLSLAPGVYFIKCDEGSVQKVVVE